MGTLSRLRHTFTTFIASLLLAGCGVGPEGGAAPPDPANPTDDGGTPAFCSGDSAKFEWRGGLITPVPVTSSRLTQTSSTDGAILRFHVEGDTGARPSLLFRRAASSSISGEYDLGNRNPGIDATFYAGNTPVNAVFSGSVQFDTNRSQPGPVLARVCVTLLAPNSPFDGARFYARSFPVMPWSWDDRLTIKLLADHHLNANEARAIPFADIRTDPNPLVHVSSYSSYEVGSHVAHWDSWALTNLIRARVGVVGAMGVPFVMEADGVPVYLGAFYSSTSTRTFAGPIIDLDKMNDDGFRIELESMVVMPGYPDPRADGRILKVLREAGKLLP